MLKFSNEIFRLKIIFSRIIEINITKNKVGEVEPRKYNGT